MKKFYNEHRVFAILMGIVLICFIIIVALLFKYFYFGNLKSAPKRTCEDINEGVIGDLKTSLRTDKLIKDITIRVSDKSNIIYITLEFNTSASLVEAQGKAVSSLETFGEEIRGCYDFNFTLLADATEKSDGFKIMGAANANGTNLVWNNNNTEAK